MTSDVRQSNPYSIAYYLTTDIQHIPPVIRLFPHLGGIVITGNQQIAKVLNEKYSELNIPCFYRRTKKEVHALILKNKIRTVIYTGFQVFYKGKAIQIFHGGLSDKNYVESVKILTYDYVLFPGEKTRDKVKNAGYLKSIPKWDIIGYPKFDPLLTKTLQFAPQFQNGRKTILYAPTWVSQHEKFKMIKFSSHGESSLHLWATEIVKALSKTYNLIIKFHSRIYREPGDIYDQINQAITDLGVQSTVLIKQDDNILTYMAEADLMISDISTACYEWFHFDKPIVFANPAPEFYKPSTDIGSNTFAWQAGDVIYKAEEIHSLVQKNLEIDNYKKIRNEIFNYTVYKPDGKATERQSSAIIQFCSEYQNTPFFWLMFTTGLTRRLQRTKSKLLNMYGKFLRRNRGHE